MFLWIREALPEWLQNALTRLKIIVEQGLTVNTENPENLGFVEMVLPIDKQICPTIYV